MRCQHVRSLQGCFHGRRGWGSRRFNGHKLWQPLFVRSRVISAIVLQHPCFTAETSHEEFAGSVGTPKRFDVAHFVLVSLLDRVETAGMEGALMESTGKLGLAISLPEPVEGFLVDAGRQIVKIAIQKGVNHFLVAMADVTEMGGVMLQFVSLMSWLRISLGRGRVRNAHTVCSLMRMPFLDHV